MKKIIHEIFNESPLAIEPIPHGLTNNNYKVTLKSQTVVLRLPKPENKSLFDYEHEAKVLALIAPLDLDTPLIYYNKSSGIKCSAYVPNTRNFHEKYAVRATQLIKKLHSLKQRSGKTFDIKGKLMQYRQRTQNPQYDLSIYDPIIDSLHLENLTLCHNDLVEGNFLFSDERDYLIDYEYAMDNDPLFDLMSFITENDIQDQQIRKRIYDTYFDEPLTADLKKRLNHFETVHHLLWCTWAMMMVESDDNPIFETIRDLKYQRLMDCL